MNTVLIVTLDSIRSLLRQKLLLGLMLAMLGVTVLFGLTFSRMNPVVITHAGTAETVQTRSARESMGGVFQSFFYAAASFGGSLVALAIFSTAVSSEIRKGTIRLTLSKPVSRTEFLLGKYLGGVAVMAVYALLASGAMVGFAKMSKLELPPAFVYAPWLMFCRQLMLGSLAMALSLFMNPFVAATLAFFAGNGLYGEHNPLFYVLPSYDAFNVVGNMMSGTVISGHDVIFLSLYALDFVVLMLLLGMWRFRKRELIG